MLILTSDKDGCSSGMATSQQRYFLYLNHLSFWLVSYR